MGERSSGVKAFDLEPDGQCVSFQSGPSCLSVSRTRWGRWVVTLETPGQNLDGAAFAVGLEIVAGHQTFARQDRQTVVAVESFCGWFENFEHLVKGEELLDAVSIPEDRIERREEDPTIVTRPNTLEPNSEIEVCWLNPTTAHAAAVKDEVAGDDVVGFFEVIEGGDDILLCEPEGLGNGAGGRPAVTRQSLQRQGFDSPPPGNGFPTPGFGDDPFGEVVCALKISPLSDCQLA